MDSLHEHESSTSVSTLRGLSHLDVSLHPEPAYTPDDHRHAHFPLRPSSPHSAFQSEPGSPSGDSVSSFPSVGSSFLFSSGPTSPPHPDHHSEPEDELGDSTSGLVIPSLMLPSPSRRPTAYGQTLGDVRLLLLGPRGLDMSAVASQLVDDNEDVVEVGLWEEVHYESVSARGKRKAVLHVSTDWVEHRDRHGLERIEPARNVEIVELSPYDSNSEAQSIVERVLPVIHYPFREVLNILNHDHPPSGTLAHLLSSSCSPLYTALVMLAAPSALSPVEKSIIESLSTHIPIVLLPPSSPFYIASPPHERARRASSSHLSAFRPSSIAALRAGLFRTPTTLATLRSEAAARFLRWREVERAVERVHWSAETSIHQRPSMQHRRSGVSDAGSDVDPERNSKLKSNEGWFDKQAWEAQWELNDSLSQEVALHLRRRRRSEPPRRLSPRSTRLTGQQRSSSFSTTAASADSDSRGLLPSSCNAALDPLHLPSLVVFSFSLLGALRTRVARLLGWKSGEDVPRRRPPSPRSAKEKRGENGANRGVGYTFGLGLALVSAFCAGMGIGLVVATRF